MKKLIIIASLILAGCAQQPAPTTAAVSTMDAVNAKMADFAKCQRLGYLAATDGDKDEIGALKFDIRTRVKAGTINIDRQGCEQAINLGKSEGFEARNKAELALRDAAAKAW